VKSGAEKSDTLKVPAKPANKAAQSAAELVEGSGGTEGNAGLQRTVRTQSREAVSQAHAYAVTALSVPPCMNLRLALPRERFSPSAPSCRSFRRVLL
jgi:hypothetical protein